MNKLIKIDGVNVGLNYKPYVIAEVSANHNGSMERALETIKAAKEAGASAVKIQSYTADTMTIDCDKKDFQIKGGLWDGYKLYDLYKWAETPFEWHKDLFEYAKSIGITLFSTPFDETAVDLLEDLNTPAYKIASFEATDIPLLKYVASTKKPVILSTGMCNKKEIDEAVETILDVHDQLIVLHCVSSYPAPIESANLIRIKQLAEHYKVLTGLSDHTLGTIASITAVGLGAVLLEKHFTLNRQDKGPDSEFSLEPDELKDLCELASQAKDAIGAPGFERQNVEKDNLHFRRSIYFVKDLKAGEVITAKSIRRIRPGYGLAPKNYDYVVGKTVNQDVHVGDPVLLELINE